MIARPLSAPPPSRPSPGTRAGRTAVTHRRSLGVRRRYRHLSGVCLTICLVTGLVMVWLLLVASITRTSYEISKVNRERAALEDQTTRLDDTIARLESRDRLAMVAASLGMSDPRTFAIVQLPQTAHPNAPARGLAFLSAIGDWIK
jgi:cell division protein FtsL